MKKVLIVESDEREAREAERILCRLGYEAVVCPADKTLAVVFIELEPEVVIIYRKLFIKNRQLFISGERDRLSTAFLVVTSSAYLTKERVRDLGADSYIHKPFELNNLKTVLEEFEGVRNKKANLFKAG